MKKLTLLVGIAIGYVLGSRAGRERFEQIRSGARKVASNPTVQSAASKAQETVATQAPVVAEAVKEKATAAASAVADKVHGGESSTGSFDEPSTSSFEGTSTDLSGDLGTGRS